MKVVGQFLRIISQLANQIIWDVDLLHVGSVCWAGLFRASPSGLPILSLVCPIEFPERAIKGQ
jgi:hypothetical protein